VDEPVADGVKSARRVFEFLEYFAEVQRAVSVAELANRFGYPNSSVSAVMRTMVGLGYLAYSGASRTYLPTARLPFLTGWIGTRLFDEESVRAVMQELSEVTGETILLGAQNGTRLQYIQVLDATGPVRLHATSGSVRALPHTAVGLVLLSRYTDVQLGPLIRRINHEEPDPAKHVALGALLQTLAEVRRNGYALSLGGIVPGAGAVAMFLPEQVGVTRLAIGVSSVESVLVQHQERFIRVMRQAIERHVPSRG
jgi:IclR family KDG regulon transcriptional repressor